MTSFGVDTNVLLSWLLNEGIEKELTEQRYRISDVVLAETAWVLRSSFQFSRLEIARVFRQIHATTALIVRNRDDFAKALSDFENGPADLADYLLMRENESAGCSATLTNDKKASRHPGFQLLEG